MWAHRAALDADATFEAFFFVPELLHSAEAQALDDQCRRRTSNSYQVSSKIIDRLSERNRPDGLVSIIEQPRWTLDRILLPPAALIVVADGLRSPGNLGTVILTIDACRADLLLVTNAPIRPDSEKVFQGSRGLRLSLTVPQLIVDDPATAIDWLHARSVAVLVADAVGGVAGISPAADPDARTGGFAERRGIGRGAALPRPGATGPMVTFGLPLVGTG